MEILNNGDSPILVTNIEVLNILSRRIQTRQQQEERDANHNTLIKKSGKLRHRDFIEQQVLNYLESTPCVYADLQEMPELVVKLKGSTINENKMHSIKTNGGMDKARNSSQRNGKVGFNLTDADTLQILNHMPTEPVEFHLMIEELSNRMDENQQNELITLISEYSKRSRAADGVEAGQTIT